MKGINVLFFVGVALMIIGLAMNIFKGDGSDHQAKDRFTYQCELKGGVALYGHKIGLSKGGRWLGCYKGVTEIFNEG